MMAKGTPSSKAAAQAAEGLAALLAAVLSRSLDDRGTPTAEAMSVIELRNAPDRERLLRELVVGIMPMEVNPALWVDWLSGHGLPPTSVKVARPDMNGQDVGRGMSRSSARVKKAVGAVEGAKRSVARAQERVADAKQKLAEAAAQDAAIVQYAVSEHLARIMAPIFAMGPAWTLMRVVSATVPPKVMKTKLAPYTDPDERADMGFAARVARQNDTDQMLFALDEWSGDDDFEGGLRDAILSVTKRYRAKHRSLSQRRSRYSIFSSVGKHAATTDAVEILGGVRQSDF